jgi:HSP20 family molecular chaperone IbpA
MSRMTLLDGSMWLSVGVPCAFSGAGNAEGGYPPYNIELLPDGAPEPQALRVTLAVAGFSADELEVSIEDGNLTIRGKQRDEQAKDYLHRGIAARQFKRSFQLARGVEVRKAELDNGLLAIELVRPRQRRMLKVGVTAVD